jgi:hypothetical protein
LRVSNTFTAVLCVLLSFSFSANCYSADFILIKVFSSSNTAHSVLCILLNMRILKWNLSSSLCLRLTFKASKAFFFLSYCIIRTINLLLAYFECSYLRWFRNYRIRFAYRIFVNLTLRIPTTDLYCWNSCFFSIVTNSVGVCCLFRCIFLLVIGLDRRSPPVSSDNCYISFCLTSIRCDVLYMNFSKWMHRRTCMSYWVLW